MDGIERKEIEEEEGREIRFVSFHATTSITRTHYHNGGPSEDAPALGEALVEHHEAGTRVQAREDGKRL